MRDVILVTLVVEILTIGVLKAIIEFNPPPRPAPPATICEHDGVRKLCRDTFKQQDI